MVGLLVVAAGLLALSAMAKAAVDVLSHQPGNNIFAGWGPFWDARVSWKRKYKDYDGGDLRPRFLGSTGPLVLLTDFWHLAGAVYLSGHLVGGGLLGVALPEIWWAWLGAFAAVKVGFGLVFELFYHRIFRLKFRPKK